MTADSIFLIQDDTKLVALPATAYESEDLLQQALANFPEVLAGGTTGEGERKLLLVRREMGIATAEGGPATFSLDHLFIDTDGVPVLVEVKRSSDTRARREVVAQMLDYAANAVRYWPLPTLQDQMEKTAVEAGTTLEQLMQEEGVDPDHFWAEVEKNLRIGQIRMVFVADRLSEELVRIIEFLNEQMSPGEVLGVEVVQYRAGTTKVLVPRRKGATAAAADKKSPAGAPWDRESFLDIAEQRCSPTEVEIMKRLFEHVARTGKFSWGRGVSPGVSGWYQVGDVQRAVWTMSTGHAAPTSNANIYFWIGQIKDLAAPANFERFAEQLSSIPAFKSEFDKARASGFAKKYPGSALKALTLEDAESVVSAIDELSGGAGVDVAPP